MRKSASATVMLALALATITVFIPSPGDTQVYQIRNTIYTNKTKKAPYNSTQGVTPNTGSNSVHTQTGGTAPASAGSIGDLRYADNIPVMAQKMNTIAFNESKRYMDAARGANPAIPDAPLFPLVFSLTEFNNRGSSAKCLFFSSPMQYDKMESYGKSELQLLGITWRDAIDSGSWTYNEVDNYGRKYIGPLQFSHTFGSSYPAIASELGILYTTNSVKRQDIRGWKPGDRWNLADIYNTFWGVQGYLVKTATTNGNLKSTPNAEFNSYGDYTKMAILSMCHNIGESVLTSSSARVAYIELSRKDVFEYAIALGSDEFISALRATIVNDRPQDKDAAFASAKKVFSTVTNQLNVGIRDDLYKRVVDGKSSISKNEKAQYPVRIISSYIMLEERFKGGW